MEYLNAFLCGGILCAAGQILIDRTHLTPARILTGYVLAGVILGALGWYDPLAEWGGAGAHRAAHRFWRTSGGRRSRRSGERRPTRRAHRRTGSRCWRRHRRNSVRFSGRAAVQKR